MQKERNDVMTTRKGYLVLETPYTLHEFRKEIRVRIRLIERSQDRDSGAKVLSPRL